MKTQQQAGIPTLQSFFNETWSGDVSADIDYSPTEPDSSDGLSDEEDSFDGSSDEQEGISEPDLDNNKEEDWDMDSEEGQEVELAEDQVAILQEHVAEFRAADLHRRSAIIKNCLRSIQAGWQPKDTFNRKKVEKLIRRYLSNKGRRAKKKSTLNLGRKWTYRDVVMDIYREELHIMALSLSNSKAGSSEYLKYYPIALKTIEGGLNEGTKAKFRALAKKWTEDKPPPQQQWRMMEKHGMSTFRNFARYAYSQFGMRIAVLAAYCDGEGDPSVTLLDINERLGATSFKRRHEHWENDPLVQDFSRWAAESFGRRSNDSDEEGPKKSKGVPLEIKLRADARGYPMLPSWDLLKDTELTHKKYLIGRYLSEMYQMASGGGKGRIPWMQLRQAQGDYILDEYLPAGITLTQYHHIRLAEANSLLQHWTTRQAAGQIAFRFKKMNTTSRQHKPASTEGGVSDDVPRGAKKAQAQGCDSDSQGDGEGSDGNDAQTGRNTAEDPGPSRRPQNRHYHRSELDKAAEKPAGLPTKADRANPPCPLINRPCSLTNGPQFGPAEEHSPQSIMKKPWGDKYNFLASLSKDGKYQDLLREINQAFSSGRVIYVKRSATHPAWARWTWTQAWLPEAFHSGGDKPVWQWLQSRPYIPDLSLEEGVCGDFSADAIALGIGCLLRDMEALQFSDEFHPPQHVAHSKVSFGVVGTIIRPALDDFSEIIRDHNKDTATKRLPAASPSTGQELQGKRRRKGQGNDDKDTEAHIQNRQKVDQKVGSVLPQARRSGRATRPTERAQESIAVLARNRKGASQQ